jgi:hypothetical protein
MSKLAKKMEAVISPPPPFFAREALILHPVRTAFLRAKNIFFYILT